jgi:hypothetical protein
MSSQLIAAAALQRCAAKSGQRSMSDLVMKTGRIALGSGTLLGTLAFLIAIPAVVKGKKQSLLANDIAILGLLISALSVPCAALYLILVTLDL